MSSAEHKANAAATAARDAAIMLHTVMDSDDVTPETQAEAQYRLANAITYAQDAIDQLTHDETTCPWCGDINSSPDGTLDLDAILIRANAATPGPWIVTAGGIETSDRSEEVIVGEYNGLGNVQADDADLYFVAAARTDIPALLVEVERLREQLYGK